MCSDSLQYDAQNALEKSMAAMAHAQARVSGVWGVGEVESEKTISPVQAVIDDEIIGYVRHYLRGFPVDEASLAVEEVRKAGVTGSFIESDHTLEHFRSALYHPDLLVRLPREKAGRDDTMQHRAEEWVRKILKEDPRPRVTPEQARELERIEEAYTQY
jgi:trimethylamine--corrinoid protein Co-methyltransferase